MSDTDFDALVTLIANMIAYSLEQHQSPNDRPRMERAYREKEEAIEHARSILVL